MPLDLKERKRLEALLAFEKKAAAEGFKRVAGVDEVGRGPLAGPVVACACVLPKKGIFPHLNDSKQLTKGERETLHLSLTTHPEVDFGIGIIDHEVIDVINIFQATVQAMLEAISKLKTLPDLLLVDGMELKNAHCPSWKIIKGDALSQSIAAASVIAKVTRDKLMEEYHETWPGYGFKQHKGYPTPEHLKSLHLLGPCQIHRTSFAPVRKCHLTKS